MRKKKHDFPSYITDLPSASQSDKYVKQVLKHCSKISEKPKQERMYEILYPNPRDSKINKHIVYIVY